MHASNKPEDPDSRGFELRAGEHAAVVRGLWAGSLGVTVRCVPTRRTVLASSGDGWLFAKWRVGHRRAAAAEWRWLHLLPMFGLRVPVPLAWLQRGRRSLLVTAALPGRALDAWFVEAAREGWLPELVRYACRQVAPRVRRLHERGLVYRDLYWNHVFAEDPRADSPPAFLDVERVFAPRWRWRRWLIKDLAGLWSSLPVSLSARCGLRFLRAYLGSLRGEQALILAIASKARRVRQHLPRYG